MDTFKCNGGLFRNMKIKEWLSISIFILNNHVFVHVNGLRKIDKASVTFCLENIGYSRCHIHCHVKF